MPTTPLPRPAELAALPHSGLSVGEYYSMHFMAAMLPLSAGLLFFGWRAGTTVLLVGGSTASGIAIWRRLGARGHQLSYPHALWFALLLAMMLPAHLAATQLPNPADLHVAGLGTPWFLLPAAGLFLAFFLWLLGGLGAGRIHPVLLTYLLLVGMSAQLLTPHWVLQRHHLLLGDLLNGKPPAAQSVETDSWYSRWKIPGQDAEMAVPASTPLSLFTRNRQNFGPGWLPIQSLLREKLPPLEDLVVGGHPSPIGTGSAIAVIVGGLFLLYRGLIDFRIPLIIILVDFAGLLILPTPTVLSNQTTWHWIISRQPDIGWSTGITFASYELMASPVLFMAFFLATGSTIRPMSRRARVIYAFLAGAASAALQLYAGVAIGPYLALLLASLLTPLLDMWFRPRAMI